MHKIVMEITFLIMENHGKNHGIVFFNFYGNPENKIVFQKRSTTSTNCMKQNK